MQKSLNNSPGPKEGFLNKMDFIPFNGKTPSEHHLNRLTDKNPFRQITSYATCISMNECKITRGRGAFWSLGMPRKMTLFRNNGAKSCLLIGCSNLHQVEAAPSDHPAAENNRSAACLGRVPHHTTQPCALGDVGRSQLHRMNPCRRLLTHRCKGSRTI